MAKFGIGQAVRRVEDQRFLQGLGRYVEDISLPGQCYGVTVLSPHAHARIKRVDVSKAKAAPGVLCVLTGADAVADKLGSFTAHLMPEDFGAPKGHRTFQPVLNAEKVRFVGDRVAFVVAETLTQARDAAELVEIDYEPLPAVVNLEDAAKDGATKVYEDCPQGNVGFRLMFGNKDATDAAFAAAKHVVKIRVENNRLSPVTMEPRVAIGDYSAADDQYTLYATSQNPHGARMEMSHIFHVPETRVRVVSPDVGGGFGLKNIFPDDALVLWASRKIRRPVKWVATRSESMLTDHSGREMVYYGELALDERGKILALRARCLFQLGAYFVGAALAAGAFSVRFIPEAYDIQTLHIMSQGLFTNTSQSGPYRGAGRPEAAYFMERLIEQAARQIGIDRAEIRRRNLIPPNKLPYATPTLWNYDSGEFVRLMDKCMETSDWKGFTARKRASEKNGKLRGRAVSYYIEFGGIFNERMDIKFNPDGTLNVFGGTHSHGQGHATVFAQLVHDRLGVPFDSIRYIQGDTAQVAIGRGTYAARSATVGGNALLKASEAIIEKGKPMAATLMEADAADIEFKDGQYRVVGTDKAIGITDVAMASYAPMGPLTEKFGVGLEATGSYSAAPPSHPNGSHVCELEVDPETGEVTLDRYFVVDDLGRILNPMIVRGQIQGGVVQGIGQALLEHQVYDR
ncbi:MAG TPA: xanthine dehydrogenase family protein molybdopterin-binding subunit, partial [Xanthobacteraceae bacterium]|nr:xanthine dehydrogenase family protein molybdopterin-binding subunit [Xanthobacteraceae bacterium]